MNWFYESGGQQQGPVAEQELDRLLSEGKITPNTLIWREGMADWQPLRVVRAAAAEPPAISTSINEAEVPPGYVRCSLTGKVIPESEAVYIQGKPYSAEAKPQVLHSLQAGGSLPTAEDAERTGPAWEHRQELGVVTAAWETVKSVLKEPTKTFSQMKREGGIGTPLTYFLLVGSIGLGFFQICIFAATVTGLLPANPSTLQQQQQMTLVQLFFNLLFTPVQVAVGAFIQSGIVHLSLMICRGANRPFETTFRTLCYSNGAIYALFVVPICGWFAAMVYGLVLPVIGIARTHEIGTGRAVLAVYLPWILCCVLAVLFGGALAAFLHQSNVSLPQ